MADPRGFIKVRQRELPADRPVALRLLDFNEVHDAQKIDEATVRRQASRCMDCGVPFCHFGCPLGNLPPEWNDQIWRGQWSEAYERLSRTNNFPEFTGRVCPAPCETACVLGINQPAVTIKNDEISIIEKAFEDGIVKPVIPTRLSGYTVAVVGSGPSGLAAAQQLTRAGHTVAVYERDQKVGGLLRYGIPNFKLEKRFIDRRIEQMQAEGTRFRTGIEVGKDITWEELRERYDAVVLAIGSTRPRNLPAPGRELKGVHFAMEFLHCANDLVAGEQVENPLLATDKHVVVIGGGDTGSDCVGTSLRQGAASVVNLEITPQPSVERPPNQPWPTYPMIFRVSTSHEEGGERRYRQTAVEFVADEVGHVRALRVADAENFQPVPGTEREIPADLVLLSMGFVGPEVDTLTQELHPEITERGTISRNDSYMSSEPGVFVAGDCGRGQSLVVWAIAEGRACAAEVDAFLEGSTQLPRPINPTDVSLRY